MGDITGLARLAALTRMKPSGLVTSCLGVVALALGVVTAVAEGGSASALVGNLILNPFTIMGIVLIALGVRRKAPAPVDPGGED